MHAGAYTHCRTHTHAHTHTHTHTHTQTHTHTHTRLAHAWTHTPRSESALSYTSLQHLLAQLGRPRPPHRRVCVSAGLARGAYARATASPRAVAALPPRAVLDLGQVPQPEGEHLVGVLRGELVRRPGDVEGLGERRGVGGEAVGGGGRRGARGAQRLAPPRGSRVLCAERGVGGAPRAR